MGICIDFTKRQSFVPNLILICLIPGTPQSSGVHRNLGPIFSYSMKSFLNTGQGNYQGTYPLTWKGEPDFSRKKIMTAY